MYGEICYQSVILDAYSVHKDFAEIIAVKVQIGAKTRF